MKMNSTCSLALLTATSALLFTSAALRAADTDDRIESSAKKSYVFKTYLKDDAIKTESKHGAVTLTVAGRVVVGSEIGAKETAPIEPSPINLPPGFAPAHTTSPARVRPPEARPRSKTKQIYAAPTCSPRLVSNEENRALPG
jgi:cell division septation protein DedD